MSSTYMGYITFKNQREAKKICRTLVEKKLIACANILPAHTAIYEWKRKINSTREVAAMIKTQKAKIKKIENEVLKMHSYEEPALVFWPLTAGSKSFLKWIQTQTR